MQCMEIWGGNRPADSRVSTPGLEARVISVPLDGAGGDVHYVSVCGGGIVTRIVLADIAGHGTPVAGIALELRQLIRRYINTKTHIRLIYRLNEQMQSWVNNGLFATSIVASYHSKKRRLTLCNAGHPRPLLYRARTGIWSLLNTEHGTGEEIRDLPLGILGGIKYSQMAVALEPNDMVLLYTDLLIETHDSQGTPLGEEGVLSIAQRLGSDGNFIAARLLAEIRAHAGPHSPSDDVTVMELRHTGEGPRPPSLRGKLKVYGKVFKLIRT